jgi:hypothetical protein
MQAHVRSLLAALALVGSLALPSALEAQVPRTMTVQGVLRDAAGVPVDQATQFRFELLDGGTSLWLESRSVTPRAGLFTVTLGTDTPIDPAFFDRGVSLRVTVDGESMDPIPLTSVPYAFRAETAERFDGDVSWGQITDVPSGFADGTDDGTTYEAGFGLSLTGSRFAADTTEVQARVSVGCPMGQSISAIGADGSVTCETDDVGAAGTTYNAGAGLVLTGTTFAVDPSVVQGRVSGVCPVGQAIRAIDAMGMVSCQPATTYTAGAGLSLAGTTFATDFAAVQARVSGTCPAGQAIRAIDGMGSVTCQASTSYAAGTGLTLTGSTFSVDTSAIQARVSGTCPSGQAIRGVNADGTVVCESSAGASGVTFVRWGRSDCPTGTSLVYSGFAAGGNYQHGGGVNALCLTDTPTWDNFSDGNQNGNLIYGTEYEATGYGLASVSPFNSLNDRDAPCAVCLDAAASTQFMLPGSQTCPSGWSTRVQGYLMAQFYTQGADETVCVDRNATALPGGTANDNGSLWYPTEAECGSLRCGAGQYVQDRELTCSVCTR